VSGPAFLTAALLIGPALASPAAAAVNLTATKTASDANVSSAGNPKRATCSPR